MTDTILFIIIVTLGSVGMSLLARHVIMTGRRKGAEYKSDKKGVYSDYSPSEDKQDIKIEILGDAQDREIMRTIQLIGHKAYKEMTNRINNIVKRHRFQNSMTVSLTCGPDTFDGAHELHRLLPGEPLKLIMCRTSGVDTIDAYFNGVRIGRLALTEAYTISEVMKTNRIVGAYVAEQNCYGCLNSHQMNIIIFFEERKRQSAFTELIKKSMHSIANSKKTTTEICMN
ncbi:MAG: hypothetical protein HDS84_05910 [Bacteroidales bacterium]|nr:hypothetical protein [Bacteroidales bacterium]